MKVVNVVPHPQWRPPPGTTLLREWSLPGGRSVFIGGREWAGQLGHWVLAGAGRHGWEWEVWQPETEADLIYAHAFEDGVVHRLFPAEERVYNWGGLRPERRINSRVMLDHLNQLSTRTGILVLHGFGEPMWYELLERIGRTRACPIFLVGHGNAQSLVQMLRASRHPLSFPACVIEQMRIRRHYTMLDGISAPDVCSLAVARSWFFGQIQRLTMGCDFAFWTPAPDQSTRSALRTELGIPADRVVFLSSAAQLVHRRKQIGRIIEAFRGLPKRTDFTLVIVGDADRADMEYLRGLAGDLAPRQLVIFHPYVTGEALRRLYWVSDIFVSASSSEGGPVSVMEAMACNIPVLTTPVGATFELLQECGAGRILPAGRYQQWPGIIHSILKGDLPRPVERDVARNEFDWPQVASRFEAVLGQLARRYFGEQSVVSPAKVPADLSRLQSW